MTPVAASSVSGPSLPPELLRVGRDFEAVFARQLLQPLMETSLGNGGGGGVYGSMVVDSLAMAVTEAGGLGLAEVVARSLLGRPGAPQAESVPPPSSSGGTRPFQRP